MRKKLPFIKESVKKLQKLLKMEKETHRYKRLHFLYLVKTKQAKTRQEIAKIVGMHRDSIACWLNAYENGGLEKMLSIKKA